jgi:hypothetical protein
MIANTSQPTSISAALPIHLGVGQTSFDNQLTLTATRTSYGALRILLKNNGRYPIVVDSYRLSGGTGSDCQGAAQRIAANTADQLCTVVPLGDVRTPTSPIFGKTGSPHQAGAAPAPIPVHNNVSASQSLQLILTWHPLARVKAMETPSPSPLVSPSS